MILFDDNALKVLEYITEKKRFSEREVKKKLKIDAYTIRRILYKLQEYGVVYPIKMITIKEGKYDYEWGVKVDKETALKILAERTLSELLEVKRSMDEVVYVCEECNVVLSFDEAEELDMKCPECGIILEVKENIKIYEIEEKISKVKEILNNISKKKAVEIKATSK